MEFSVLNFFIVFKKVNGCKKRRVGFAKFMKVRICIGQKHPRILSSNYDFKNLRAFWKETLP